MPFSSHHEQNPQHRGPEPAFILGFSALEITLTACGALLLLAFLFLMQGMLNPPIIAGAGIILLWPVRRHRTVQAILLAGGFLLSIWFLHKLRTILIPFGTLYLVAYLFDPIVTYLNNQRGVARGISAFVVTLLLISVIGLFVVLLAPHIIKELDTLGTRAVHSIQSFKEWLLVSPFIDELAAAGIDKEELITRTMASIQGVLRYVTDGIPTAIENIAFSVGSIFGIVTIIVVTPVILFYTLKDYKIIKNGIKYMLPTINGKQDYLHQIGDIVGRYLRGQLTISAIAAITVSIALMLGDIPFALLIGIVAGLLNMIPSLGAILTNIIGISIALVFGERGIVDVVIVVTVLFAESLLEQAVLVPKILSQHVGLHPVVILLSLFVFGFFFGFFGLFIAVPLMALVTTAYTTIRKDTSLDLSSFLSFPISADLNPYPPFKAWENHANPDDVTFSSSDERNVHDSIHSTHAGLEEE